MLLSSMILSYIPGTISNCGYMLANEDFGDASEWAGLPGCLFRWPQIIKFSVHTTNESHNASYSPKWNLNCQNGAYGGAYVACAGVCNCHGLGNGTLNCGPTRSSGHGVCDGSRCRGLGCSLSLGSPSSLCSTGLVCPGPRCKYKTVVTSGTGGLLYFLCWWLHKSSISLYTGMSLNNDKISDKIWKVNPLQCKNIKITTDLASLGNDHDDLNL